MSQGRFTQQTHKHWEYQSFTLVQVQGDWQAVGPVQPFPPHCSQCPASSPVGPGLVAEVVVGSGLPPSLPPKVEPMGPTLMLE